MSLPRTALSTQGWPACSPRSPRSRSSRWGLFGGNVSACDAVEVCGARFRIWVEVGSVTRGNAWPRQDPGALGRGSVRACVLRKEAVTLSETGDRRTKALTGVLLPGGDGGRHAGAGRMGAGRVGARLARE